MAGRGRQRLLLAGVGCALVVVAGLPGGAAQEKQYVYGGVDATGERLGVMPRDTGVDMSQPNEGYCDGCLSTLEAFHMQWLKYVSKESNEVRLASGLAKQHPTHGCCAPLLSASG